MPRGVYDRKKAEVSTENLPTIPQNEDARRIQVLIDKAVDFIKSSHNHIAATTIEIGHRFFEVKQILDMVASDLRRTMKIPRFSNWMNHTAPEACHMSKRTAWSYYQAYAEAQATGLEQKTIIALAPSVLKTEKSRASVVNILTRKPELVAQLNEAAKDTKELKRIAGSDEVKEIIKSLEPSEPVSKPDRITKTIVNAYQVDLKKDRSPEHLNRVLTELSNAVSSAMQTLNLTEYFTVSTKHVEAVPVREVEIPLPATQAEAVEQLSQLIRAGAAKVVAVGA